MTAIWQSGDTATHLVVGLSGKVYGEPETVTVVGPYAAPGAMPDEWVVRTERGDTMAVQGRNLTRSEGSR